MKTSQEILINLQTMDKTLANVQNKMLTAVLAREQNINALDDEMSETWANFRTEMQELQAEVNKVIECILFEDNDK